jgi:hypothetical protein
MGDVLPVFPELKVRAVVTTPITVRKFKLDLQKDCQVLIRAVFGTLVHYSVKNELSH